MKIFSNIEIKLTQVETELNKFETLLKKAELSERTDLLPFFNGNKQLSAFVAMVYRRKIL